MMIKNIKIIVGTILLVTMFVNMYFQICKVKLSGQSSKHFLFSNLLGEGSDIETRPDITNSNWFDAMLYTLRYEMMLTKNIKMKEIQWNSVDVTLFRSTHRELLNRRALVFLGWVAYHDAEQLALSGGPSGTRAIILYLMD